jgi:hypothetical protein
MAPASLIAWYENYTSVTLCESVRKDDLKIPPIDACSLSGHAGEAWWLGLPVCRSWRMVLG